LGAGDVLDGTHWSTLARCAPAFIVAGSIVATAAWRGLQQDGLRMAPMTGLPAPDGRRGRSLPPARPRSGCRTARPWCTRARQR
jgi:hypothetical protein